MMEYIEKDLRLGKEPGDETAATIIRALLDARGKDVAFPETVQTPAQSEDAQREPLDLDAFPEVVLHGDPVTELVDDPEGHTRANKEALRTSLELATQPYYLLFHSRIPKHPGLKVALTGKGQTDWDQEDETRGVTYNYFMDYKIGKDDHPSVNTVDATLYTSQEDDSHSSVIIGCQDSKIVSMSVTSGTSKGAKALQALFAGTAFESFINREPLHAGCAISLSLGDKPSLVYRPGILRNGKRVQYIYRFDKPATNTFSEKVLGSGTMRETPMDVEEYEKVVLSVLGLLARPLRRQQ